MSHAFFSSISSLLPFWLFSQLLIFVSIGHDATEKQRKTFGFPKYWLLRCKNPGLGKEGWLFYRKSCSHRIHMFGLSEALQTLVALGVGGWRDAVVHLQKALNWPTRMDQIEGSLQQDWVPSMKEVRGNKGFLIRSLHEKRMKEIMRFPTLSVVSGTQTQLQANNLYD